MRLLHATTFIGQVQLRSSGEIRPQKRSPRRTRQDSFPTTPLLGESSAPLGRRIAEPTTPAMIDAVKIAIFAAEKSSVSGVS